MVSWDIVRATVKHVEMGQEPERYEMWKTGYRRQQNILTNFIPMNMLRVCLLFKEIIMVKNGMFQKCLF